MWDVLKTTGADPISPRPLQSLKTKKRHDGTGGVSRFMAPIYSKRKDPGLFFFLCFFRKSVVTVSYAINIHMYKAYHGIYDSLKKDIIFRE